MTNELVLPDPCKPGQHSPAIVHRCGGKDANYWNACGKCGREIQRGDGEPWMTQEQVDECVDQMRSESSTGERDED